MISNKTQRKLDWATEGLPTDPEQEHEAHLKEMAETLGTSIEEAKKIDDDFDDVAEEQAKDAFLESQYESQRERDVI